MARGKMREQIKQIENQRKIDRMGNLLEMDGKCRILGRKSALIDIDEASKEDVSPEKKMRTIFTENEDEKVHDSGSDRPAEVQSNSQAGFANTQIVKLSRDKTKINKIEGIIGFENETSENKTTEKPKLINLDKLFEEPNDDSSDDDSSDDEFISDTDGNETTGDNITDEIINGPTGSIEGLKKILYAKLHDKIVSGKISNEPVEKITISDEEDDQFMSSSEEEDSDETKTPKPIKSINKVADESLPQMDVKDKPIILSSSDEEDQVEDLKNVNPNTSAETEAISIQEPVSKDTIPLLSASQRSANVAKKEDAKSKLENLVKQKEAALLAKILKSRRADSNEKSKIDNNEVTEKSNDLEKESKDTIDFKPEAKMDAQTEVQIEAKPKPEPKPQSQSEPKPDSQPTGPSEEKSEAESDDSKSESKPDLPYSEPEVEPVFDFRLEALRRENELNRIRLDNASKITQAPSSDLYLDAAQLLNLFGAGIMFAPGEAEAQCARLEYDSITDGTITDDSDTFLFGGRRVYRHMTPGKMTPILHSMDDLGYNRNQLIGIAHLTGSDYCTGVNGIGPKVKVKLRS